MPAPARALAAVFVTLAKLALAVFTIGAALAVIAILFGVSLSPFLSRMGENICRNIAHVVKMLETGHGIVNYFV